MIDWNRVASLREEVGPEDFDEVVELFLDEVDEEIDGLLDLKAADLIVEKLHFLKGSALNLGFSDLSRLCQAGETALSQDTSGTVDLAAVQSTYLTSRDHFLENLPAHATGQTSL